MKAAIDAIPALKNGVGVWDLVLVGNADAADYNLVDQYTREMTACYFDAFHKHRVMALDLTPMNIGAHRYDGKHMDDSDASKTAASSWWTAAIGFHHSYLRYLQAQPEMERVAVIPEGDGLFNESVTKELFAYPTIREVRRKLNGMLAGRPAEHRLRRSKLTSLTDVMLRLHYGCKKRWRRLPIWLLMISLANTSPKSNQRSTPPMSAMNRMKRKSASMRSRRLTRTRPLPTVLTAP